MLTDTIQEILGIDPYYTYNTPTLHVQYRDGTWRLWNAKTKEYTPWNSDSQSLLNKWFKNPFIAPVEWRTCMLTLYEKGLRL